jgi:chemotaxis protein methyltransferase CheR
MIDRGDYQALKEILLETSGHSLGEGKEYLVERRLAPVADSLGHPSLTALLRELRVRRDRRTVKLVCEAMTTNESLFFRDGRPFDLLKQKIIPEFIESRRARRTLRIWSAACSTGQEAYSVAMTLAEFVPSLADWRVEVVGTDYSPSVVARARSGIFNHFEVQRGLPVTMLIKYFDQIEDGWQVKESLRKKVSFQEGNLLEPFGRLGVFDIVFCRNVLIYFDAEGKRDVLERLTKVTAPDGYLFLGAAETALGVTQSWRVVPGATTTLFQQRTETTGEASSPARATA